MLRGFVLKFSFLAFALTISEVAISAADYSRNTAARADILGGLQTALDRFQADCGRYPTTSEGFAGMVNCPTNFSGGKWSGPYLDAIPIDPWGNVYAYRCPGIYNTNGHDLYSCGYDGISKSGGDDLDDINNWDPNSPLGVSNSYYRNQLLSNLLLLTLSGIPFLGGIRLIAAIFSRRVRNSIARHPTLNTIWLLMSLAVFLFFLLWIPRLAG